MNFEIWPIGWFLELKNFDDNSKKRPPDPEISAGSSRNNTDNVVPGMICSMCRGDRLILYGDDGAGHTTYHCENCGNVQIGEGVR